jgi:hypothetical protein
VVSNLNHFTDDANLKTMYDDLDKIYGASLPEDVDDYKEKLEKQMKAHKLKVSTITDVIIRSFPEDKYKLTSSTSGTFHIFPRWEAPRYIENFFKDMSSLVAQSYVKCSSTLKKMQELINPTNLSIVDSDYMIAILRNDFLVTVFNKIKCFQYTKPIRQLPIIEKRPGFTVLKDQYGYCEFFDENFLFFVLQEEKKFTTNSTLNGAHNVLVFNLLHLFCNLSFGFSETQIETLLKLFKRCWFPLAHFFDFEVNKYASSFICFAAGEINTTRDFDPKNKNPSSTSFFKLTNLGGDKDAFLKSVMEKLDKFTEGTAPPASMDTLLTEMNDFTFSYLKQRKVAFSEITDTHGDLFSDVLDKYENVFSFQSPFYFQTNFMTSMLLLKMQNYDNVQLVEKVNYLETENDALSKRLKQKETLFRQYNDELKEHLTTWVRDIYKHCEKDFIIAEQMREIHGGHRLVIKAKPKAKFFLPTPRNPPTTVVFSSP